MRSRARLKAVGLVAIVVLFGALMTGQSQATSGGTTTIPSATGGTGTQQYHVSAVNHDDNGNFIIYSFTTSDAITAAKVDHIDWLLDMNSNNSVTDPSDGCIEATAASPTILRASLFAGGACSGTSISTADATITPSGSGDIVTFQFSNQAWRSALGFPSGTSYQYRFVSVDLNGWNTTVPSTSGFITHSGVVAANPTPSAPTSLTATAATGGTATVTWSAPTTGGAIVTYNVQRQKCAPTCANDGSVHTVNAPTTTFNDSGLLVNTTYQYLVSATNGTGTGPSATSNQTSFGTPSAPTNVTGAPGNGSITVSWTAPATNGGSTITSYTVTGSPGGTATVTGSPPATSVVVTGLTNGTPYTFTVTATNANGTGPASAASPAVTPSANQATAAPQGVQVTIQGVLSIARGLPDVINFGTVTKGVNPAPQGAGQLDYTNTLADNNPPWNVTVQSTNLTRTAGCSSAPSAQICIIPYSNLTYSPDQTITADSGSTGLPVAAAASTFPGSPDTQSTSSPKSVSTAAQGTYGTFHQVANQLSLVVPLSVRPAQYNGTLTYTITG